jgi:metal-sulfur cluster biosynthetic enzyme
MSESALPLDEQVKAKLDQVLDPELGVSIVALGLIYEIIVTPEKVCKILMTLTTIGCPLFGQIQKEIEDKVMELEEMQEVEVELSFDPPWNPDKMTLEAKVQLGLD